MHRGFLFYGASTHYLCAMHVNQRRLFLEHVAQTSLAPLMLEIERAAGHYLYDTSGKRYLDLIAGISVCNSGHSHPEIIAAIQNQSEKYMHTMVYGELVLSPQVTLATLVSEMLPKSLNTCYFVNSGSEAVDGAMKLAKRATGKTAFVGLTDAYHGSSQGPLSLMSNEYFSAAFRPLLPQIRFMRQNSLKDIELIDENTAGVVLELVQAEKGAIPCTKEFVTAVREKCNQVGALLIFDEIQTGLGRTGPMFAFEDFGIVPDILLLGKAFGGGMPLAAFVARKELMTLLSHNPVLGHITTFGGHPVSCAAAIASLEIIKRNLKVWQIQEKHNFILESFAKRGIQGISGKGLLLALDLQTEERCQQVIQICLSKGLFTDWFLFAPEKLRIAPPLSIEFDELGWAVEVISDAILE